MKIGSLNKSIKKTNNSIDSFMETIPPFIKVYSDKSVVYLPQTTGTGFTRNLPLEDGLSVRNMNFSLQSDFEFLRLARKNQEEKTFQLYYFLDSIDFHFTLNEDKSFLSPATFSNILLVSNDMQIRGKFEKNHVVRVIIISFSVSWLQRNGFNTLESCKQFLADGNERDKGILMMQYPHITDRQVAVEINKAHVPGNEFSFPIKANCLKLVEQFFEAIEKRKSVNLKESKAEYFIQMIKVEEKISACLHTNLPLIKELSKEFLMSESNLKKHFRIVYGKNIYEYYLDKKMNLARTMLLDQNNSISKVAYALGYEKVSSFSKAFVKQFGLLPSHLKTQQSSIL
ncbi:MAG: AraC family transcriptional regulator [Bacteroidota bacterium]